MTGNYSSLMQEIGLDAKSAAKQLALCSDDQINVLLADIAIAIKEQKSDILTANKIDVEQAQAKGTKDSFLDRLILNDDRIEAVINSLDVIAALPDPVGEIFETTTRPNGLVIEKRSVPIGVLGIIYESRPNVTVDTAALCLKSKNAAILRGGSESFHTSSKLHHIIQSCLEKHDLPAATISMIPNTDREMVGAMLQNSDAIDVIIPRGGKELTGRVMDEAKMPVFAHLDGNCHLYIDQSAKAEMVLDVVKNAKLRRTGICGAAESLLLHAGLSQETLETLITELLNHEVAIVGDEAVQKLNPSIQPATDDDWATEYLEKKISIKMVADVQTAIDHINHYGSHHTDAIIAEDQSAVADFFNQVDSAIVMHNASTQFADGGEFGMGAEIGIGTGKLHARGPVGVKQLTTFKYIVKGSGQTRP